MGSYKLYLAVIAIACIAAVQEASCSGELTEQYDGQEELTELKTEQEEVSGPEMEFQKCEEYKSKIWDNAFSNAGAMDLMKLTFITAEEMGSNDVCTDTIRTFINFIEVMATNENAQYSTRMFKKLLAFIVRELDTTSDKFEETTEVFERISKNPEIRDQIRHTVARTTNLLRDPLIRGRLFKVIKASKDLMTPAKKETLVKNKVKRITNAPAKMARSAFNKFGNFLRKF